MDLVRLHRRFDLDDRARDLASPRNDPRLHEEVCWLCLVIQGIEPHLNQAQCELKLGCLVEEVCHLLNAFVDAVTDDQQDKTAEPQVSIHAVDELSLVHVVVTITRKIDQRVGGHHGVVVSGCQHSPAQLIVGPR